MVKLGLNMTSIQNQLTKGTKFPRENLGRCFFNITPKTETYQRRARF